jgi:pre-mRNA-splicing factor CDC5/CEF1
MRIQYKGGVWKNSEDEILKAAVMKYGKNQWARIASLLVRKSAKHCKARWYEWLDPSIKKTEWTREEEERLLHLAKIMPTQWRTIAPIIGRTAAQCLEHYERLLDDAQRAAAPRLQDDHRQRPGDGGGGDAAAAPETKPARPDPVDMDEEEKEMLSEARARLANTRGKKAKRKAREKQLEEAKRLAQLQKRRELKAAGIAVKPARRKHGVMDMTAEIPYMRAAVPGFYDTGEEDAMMSKEKRDVRGLGRLIDKYEHQRYEKDQEIQKRREEANRRHLFGDPGAKPPSRAPMTGAARAPEAEPPLKRSRLALPAPQVSDVDLEMLGKAGASVSKAMSTAESGHGITSDLLAGLTHPVLRTPSGSVASSVRATPRTNSEAWSDIRDREVQNILKLQSSATPLVGGDNTLLPADLGVENSVTPLHSLEQTPNPLASPSIASGSTLDPLGMNDAELARTEKVRAEMLKRELSKRLEGLPEPENEYEIKVVGREKEALEDGNLRDKGSALTGEMCGGDTIMEDAEDEAVRIELEGRQRLENMKRRALSSAARRGLPLPPLSSLPKMTIGLQELVQRDHVVQKALDELLEDKNLTSEFVAMTVESLVELEDLEETAAAEALIQAEIESQMSKSLEANIVEVLESVDRTPDPQQFTAARNGTIRPVATVAEMKSLHKRHVAHLAAVLKSVQKAQHNVEIVMGGFEAKREALRKDLHAELDELKKAREQFECLSSLAAAEEIGGPVRLAEIRSALAGQQELERYLQGRFAAERDVSTGTSGNAQQIVS